MSPVPYVAEATRAMDVLQVDGSGRRAGGQEIEAGGAAFARLRDLSARLSRAPHPFDFPVIRDRNLPVAKLVPFSPAGADDQELMLVATGKLRLPDVRLDVKELLKIPTERVAGNKAIQAVLDGR